MWPDVWREIYSEPHQPLCEEERLDGKGPLVMSNEEDELEQLVIRNKNHSYGKAKTLRT